MRLNARGEAIYLRPRRYGRCSLVLSGAARTRASIATGHVQAQQFRLLSQSLKWWPLPDQTYLVHSVTLHCSHGIQ